MTGKPEMVKLARNIKRHYAIKRRLADRLRHTDRAERLTLYAAVYNELFQSVPDHPQLTAPKTPEATGKEVARRFGIIRPFLLANSVVFEVGAWGYQLSQKMARHVRRIYAMDVSDEIATRIELPRNCQLVLPDGVSLRVSPTGGC